MSFFDSLTDTLNQEAANRQTLRDLAGKGIANSAAPPPSILQRIIGAVTPGPSDPNAPAAPADASQQPGMIDRITGMFGGAQPQPPAPNMPAPLNGTPGGAAPPQSSTAPMAYADPSTAPSMTAPPPQFSAPTQMPVPRPASLPQQPAPSPFGALSPGGFGPQASAPPIFAASQGTPSGPNANAQTAVSFYQSKGLSPIAAAALVGGFQNESGHGLNTSALNPGDGSDGSNSVGIAQWNGARAQGLQQFAAANRLDPNDINTQLQYSWAELNGPEHATLSALQQAQNPVAATAAALGYERPAGWTAANPTGAKTFGSRLQSTVGLAGLGQPGGANSLPAITASGMGLQLAPGNQSPPTPSQSSAQPQPSPAPVMGYTPPSAAMTAAPGQQAITAAAAGPAISVPGYSGTFTRAASNDADGVPSQAEWDAAAKQQAAGGGAATSLPTAAPLGGAPAAQPMAPLPTRPAAPPAIPAGAQPVGAPGTTLPSAQIQALLSTPTTRPLGMALWQQALTQKSLGFLQTPDGTILSTNPQTGQVSVAYQGKPKPTVVGSSLVNPDTGAVIYDGRGNNAVSQIGEDQFGNKLFGTIDKDTGKITPINAAAGQFPSTSAGASDLHGADFLSTLDPNLGAQVRAIVEGRAPYPTGMFLKTPLGQRLAAYVTQADPTFETGNATTRVKVRNDFNTGGPNSPAGAITAGNTAIGHLGELSDAAEALGNYDSGIPGNNYINSFKNAVAQSAGGGTAVTQFNNIVGKYVEEATKLYRGTGGTESDIQRDISNLSPSMSPTQLKTAIATQAALIQSKTTALQDRWRQGMGPLVSDFPILSPSSQAALARVNQRANPATQAGAPSQSDLLAEARRRGLVN